MTAPVGLIPAHAGKTLTSKTAMNRPWAHPRSRGENVLRRRIRYPRLGSSPLTRGKPSSVVPWGPWPRLIPAHAGKTTRARPTTAGRSAHPRPRGENELTDYVGDDETGSSPLTRGKLTQRHTVGFLAGLIPAHAGKTFQRRSSHAPHAAHPRSRGENGVQPGG